MTNTASFTLLGKTFTVRTDRPFTDISDEVAGIYWEAFDGSDIDDNEIITRAEETAARLIA